MNIKKPIFIFLLCVIITTILSTLVFFTYKIVDGKQMEYINHHKEEWVELLVNNSEVLPYLEKLYDVEDELTINYRNGKLTINKSASNKFNINELDIIEKLFITFKWDTIRLRKQIIDEQKVLEITSQQIIISSFFQKHYGTAFLIYSPDNKLDSGEEIFPGWYYQILFNT